MKTVREEAFGKATVRLVQTAKGYAGVVIRNGATTQPLHGENANDLWIELIEDLDRSSVCYFGHDGARARFLRLFPDGFGGASYRQHERDYKVAAASKLHETMTAEEAMDPSPEACAQLTSVFSRTNLLAPVEQARVHQMLRSDHAGSFVKGAALMAAGDIQQGLSMMQAAMRPFGQTSWPAATFLPFLWKSEAHMFLKPRVTVDYAERVGHAFARAYSSTLSADVYASLQSLVANTSEALKPLAHADNIDVQSFIWIVGAYPETNAVAEVG